MIKKLGDLMKNDDISFVTQILKRFGTFIYTGNRLDDIAIMETELEDLYEWKLISEEDFIKSKLILKRAQNNS